MQESSFLLGLQYIVAALSLYDEYSNDVLDMPEGTCFPRFYSSLLPSTSCCDWLAVNALDLCLIGFGIEKRPKCHEQLPIQAPSQALSP